MRVSALDAEIPLRPDVFRALQGLAPRRTRRRDALLRRARRCAISRRLGVDQARGHARTRLKALRDELTRAHGRVPAQHSASAAAGSPSRARRISTACRPTSSPVITPDASGAITLTTDAVDARPVLIYATSERAAPPDATSSRTPSPRRRTSPCSTRSSRVRGEMARLLGYPNWASLRHVVAHVRRREDRVGVHRSRRRGGRARRRHASSTNCRR